MNRLTEQVRIALHAAHGYAGDFVGSEHLLMALATSPGVASMVLQEAGFSLDRLQAVVPPGPGGPSGTVPFSPGAKRVLELALEEAFAHDDEDIGTAHVLLALLSDEGPCAATRAVVDAGFDRLDLRHGVDSALAAGASDGASNNTSGK